MLLQTYPLRLPEARRCPCDSGKSDASSNVRGGASTSRIHPENRTENGSEHAIDVDVGRKGDERYVVSLSSFLPDPPIR
jgi:hypothetical protein